MTEIEKELLKKHGPGRVNIKMCADCGALQHTGTKSKLPDKVVVTAITQEDWDDKKGCKRCVLVATHFPTFFPWGIGSLNTIRGQFSSAMGQLRDEMRAHHSKEMAQLREEFSEGLRMMKADITGEAPLEPTADEADEAADGTGEDAPE